MTFLGNVIFMSILRCTYKETHVSVVCQKKGELLSVKCQCTGYICVKWPKIVYKEGNQIKWAQSHSFLIDVVIINKILPWAVGLDLAIFCI